MKKKAVRAITGLLCAVMVFSNMVHVYAMEENGTGQRPQTQESVSENDTGKDAGGTGKPKDTGEPGGSEEVEDTFVFPDTLFMRWGLSRTPLPCRTASLMQALMYCCAAGITTRVRLR